MKRSYHPSELPAHLKEAVRNARMDERHEHLNQLMGNRMSYEGKACPMNLYLLSQNVNDDWNTYDSMAVIASSEAEAKALAREQSGFASHEYHNSWVSDKDVQVTLIGRIEAENLLPHIVCASFNAG